MYGYESRKIHNMLSFGIAYILHTSAGSRTRAGRLLVCEGGRARHIFLQGQKLDRAVRDTVYILRGNHFRGRRMVLRQVRRRQQPLRTFIRLLQVGEPYARRRTARKQIPFLYGAFDFQDGQLRQFFARGKRADRKLRVLRHLLFGRICLFVRALQRQFLLHVGRKRRLSVKRNSLSERRRPAPFRSRRLSVNRKDNYSGRHCLRRGRRSRRRVYYKPARPLLPPRQVRQA